MDVNTRNRAQLKSYFVKNSIPTESNFAELIDGMLNQKDDGVVKLPGNPLTIEAAGDSASEKKALMLYQSFGDANPAWSLSLNPRSNPQDPGTAKLGLNISDGEGNSRLFIDRNTGNIGIGTVAPGNYKLSVQGGQYLSGSLFINGEGTGVIVDAGGLQRVGLLKYGGREGGIWRLSSQDFEIGRVDASVTALPGAPSQWTTDFYIDGSGNIGIGTVRPQVKLAVTGAATFGVDFQIDLRGSALESSEGTVTSLNINAQLVSMDALRGLNTVLISPSGTFKAKSNFDIYGTVALWNAWADWVNANAANGDIVAVGSFDAISNAPRGGSADRLLTAIGATQAFTMATPFAGLPRVPYALLFIQGGTKQIIEVTQPYRGPNAVIRTSYFKLLNTPAPTLRILGDTLLFGNIGIGTASPGAKLEVKGGQTILEQQAWQDATPLQNNWQPYGAGYNPPQYFKDSQGIVHLRGLIKGGTSFGYDNDGLIFTLPPGYRPVNRQLHPISTFNNTVGRLDVINDGRVVCPTGNTLWVSLDNISFRAA